MKFVKVSVQALAIVSASLVAHEKDKASEDDSSNKLRHYISKNPIEKKPVVEPKDGKNPNPKPKRYCSISVV